MQCGHASESPFEDRYSSERLLGRLVRMTQFSLLQIAKQMLDRHLNNETKQALDEPMPSLRVSPIASTAAVVVSFA